MNNYMKERQNAVFNPPKSGEKRGGVIATFRNLISLVTISHGEFHIQIDPQRLKGKKAAGPTSKFSVGAVAAVDNIIIKLQGMPNYEPMFLTDEEMVIDKFTIAVREILNSSARSKYEHVRLVSICIS